MCSFDEFTSTPEQPEYNPDSTPAEFRIPSEATEPLQEEAAPAATGEESQEMPGSAQAPDCSATTPANPPRSPYANSPYTGFYDTHTPEAAKEKKRRAFPRRLVLSLAGGLCLAAVIAGGAWMAHQQRVQANQEIALLNQRIDALQSKLDSLDRTGGNVSTPVPTGESMTPAQVYAQNVDCVVGITCDSSAAVNGQPVRRTVTGSGFILTEDGYVVTNYHVVEDASSVTVITQSGDKYEAQIVGHDSTADMALLKLDAQGLPYVTLGSSSQLAIGDMVVAIGNPLSALEATQTVGYISGKNREVTTDNNVVNMLQTDAAINSGNSGGPLFNMRGEVVGITTAKYSGTSSSGASIEGISFAIPIDDLKSSIADLQSQGYISSAYLGIMGMDVEAAAVETYGLPKGAYVDSVVEDGAAQKAGVQPKDIILQLGSYPIQSFNDLSRALRNFKAGDETTITVYRGGQQLSLPIVLGERPQEETTTDSSEQPQEGSYQEWFEYFRRFYGLP